MKKIFLAVVIPLIAAGAAKAAELEDGKFYEDVLISDDLKMEDSSNSAKEKASSLLDQKPKIIKIEGEPLQFRSARTKAAPAAPVGGNRHHHQIRRSAVRPFLGRHLQPNQSARRRHGTG